MADEEGNRMVDEDEPLEDEDEPLEDEDEPLEDEEEDEKPVPFPIKNYTKTSLAALFAPSTNLEIDPPAVESLEFHREGRLLVSVDSNSDLLQIDAVKGEVVKRFSCQKYPIGLCRYTHHYQAVLCTSRPNLQNSGNDAQPNTHDIRYLSLHDNTYQRFFHGHTDEVVSLTMNPSDDSFASASKDKTVRLWSLNSSKCDAILTIPSSTSPPYVAFDPTGKVIAVTYSTTSANVIKLFDAHNYAKGPFVTFSLEHSDIARFVSSQPSTRIEELSRYAWTNIVFSPDESYILVSSKEQSSLLFLLDAFDGNLLRCFSYDGNTSSAATGTASTTESSIQSNNAQGEGGDCFIGGACFTPDGAHVLAGTKSGKVCFWSVEKKDTENALSKKEKEKTITEMPTMILDADHPSFVKCVACSPTYGIVASSCSVVALWVDTEKHEQEP